MFQRERYKINMERVIRFNYYNKRKLVFAYSLLAIIIKRRQIL